MFSVTSVNGLNERVPGPQGVCVCVCESTLPHVAHLRLQTYICRRFWGGGFMTFFQTDSFVAGKTSSLASLL